MLWRDGVLDCGRERDIDIGAVGSAERVKAKSWPIISECVIAREMLRRELATKACFRDRKLVGWQACADRGSLRLRTLVKRARGERGHYC